MANDTVANQSTSTLVDSNAVAKRFGAAVGTVTKWVRDGVIPCVRPSRRIVRFDMDAVERAFAVNSPEVAGEK